jgi:CRISPR-associated protein Cas1
MKNNIYIFSNTILRKKDKTLCIETDTNGSPVHEADIDESEILLSPAQDNNGFSKSYIPAENVDAIYTFGSVKMNTHFLALAAKNSIPVHTFNYYGNYLGSFMPKTDINSGNIVIKQVEYYTNPIKRTELARKFIDGAALNTIANLQYYKYRNCPLDEEIERIRQLHSQLNNANSVGEILGIEGNIKNIYYKCWHKFLKQDVEFEKRVKRPPDNMINSLISFGNMVLYTVCLNELYRTGLLPSIGFLHTTGDNRYPLSFDVAEIFKPLIVDKAIFKVINLNMLDESDFNSKGDYLYMKEKAKKTFVEAIETRLKTTIMRDDLKRNVTYKTLIRMDCYKIINHLNDKEIFQPVVVDA